MTLLTRWRRFWHRVAEARTDHAWEQQSGRVGA